MAASFDSNTKKLNIDVVQVGNTLVEWVNVRLDQFTVLGVGGNPTCSSFDPGTNTLSLASVSVAGQVYRGVTLRLDAISNLTTDGSAPVAPGRQVVNLNDIVSLAASNVGKANFDAGGGAYMFFDDLLQKGWNGGVSAHDVVINNFSADDSVYFDGNAAQGANSTNELYFLRIDSGSGNAIATAKPLSGGLTYSQVTLMGVAPGGAYFPSLSEFNGYVTGDIFLGLP